MSSVKIENSTLSLYIDDIRKEQKPDTKTITKNAEVRLRKRDEERDNLHNTYKIRSISIDSDLLNIFVHIYIYMKIMREIVQVPAATVL